MEIAFLVVLIVPLTSASPLRLTPRSEAGVDRSETALLAAGSETSDGSLELHVPHVKIIPFHTEDKHSELLKHSMSPRFRARRANQRGCQLGTCQLHNLANTLYHIGKTSGKEESKQANDPQGYGR